MFMNPMGYFYTIANKYSEEELNRGNKFKFFDKDELNHEAKEDLRKFAEKMLKFNLDNFSKSERTEITDFCHRMRDKITKPTSKTKELMQKVYLKYRVIQYLPEKLDFFSSLQDEVPESRSQTPTSSTDSAVSSTETVNEFNAFLKLINPDELRETLSHEFARLAFENATIVKTGDREYKITLAHDGALIVKLNPLTKITINISKETSISFSEKKGFSNSAQKETDQICISIDPPIDTGMIGGKITSIATDSYETEPGKFKSTIEMIREGKPNRMDPAKFVEYVKMCNWKS